jgi:iron complex outermembrane recepter protein
MLLAVTLCLPAQGSAQSTPPDLSRISLEDLMNIQVVSSSRREQRVIDTAAAVYVITHEDIRRSGMTTLPDVLRLAPGVQVAQINATKWAVSIRGFNSLFSNKLLVLIDGRTVYNQLFSGVFWDIEDIPLDDIDRIEVIRGAGGALWGANAVNGVINIITKAAEATQGTRVRVHAGTFEKGSAALRVGGSKGKVDYRVFSRWTGTGSTELASGGAAGDDMERVTNGGRLDWSGGRDALAVSTQLVLARAHSLWLTPAMPQQTPLPLSDASTMNAWTLMTRWSRALERGGRVQLQSAADVVHRNEPVGAYDRESTDSEIQYETPVRRGHEIVAGAGFRYSSEKLDGHNGFRLQPDVGRESLFSVFGNDTIALAGNRLRASGGARIEYGNGVGWGVQPVARILWNVTPDRHHVWGAVSRAIHTPSLQDRSLQIAYPQQAGPGGLPLLVTLSGNPDLRSETVVSEDLGYRLALGRVQFEADAFESTYRRLRTSEPQAPHVDVASGFPVIVAPVQFGNLFDARTAGVELTARWQPVAAWRLEGSYTRFHLTPIGAPVTRDPSMSAFDSDTPRQQWQLRSLTTFGRADIDVLLFRVGALAQMGVDAYTRADARVEYPLSRGVSLAVTGQNLLSRGHAEFAWTTAQMVATDLPRNVAVSLVWRSR